MEFNIDCVYLNESDIILIHNENDNKTSFFSLMFTDFITLLNTMGEPGRNMIECIDRIYYEKEVEYFEGVECIEDNNCSLPLIKIIPAEEIGSILICSFENLGTMPSSYNSKVNRMIEEAKTIVKIEENKALLLLAEENIYQISQLIESDEYEAAANLLAEVISDFPNIPDYRINYGICLTHIFRWGEALEQLNIALKINKNSVEALLSRADLYRKLNRYNDAIVDIKKALTLRRKRDDVLFELAITYTEMNDFDNALIIANRFLKLYPKKEESYLLKGNIHEEMNEYRKAIEMYNYILFNINPFSDWAFYYRGRAKSECLLIEKEAIEDLEMSHLLGNPLANELIEDIMDDSGVIL